MDPATVEILECTGNIVRTYENSRTGEEVSVFVIVGPTGPITVHTPEICFRSQDYPMRGPHQRVAISTAGRDDHFWVTDFEPKDLSRDLLRVYYAWGTGDGWSAPDYERVAFAGSPYLYKIQASCRLPAGTNLKTHDTCRQFLEDFLPVLQPRLVEPAGK